MMVDENNSAAPRWWQIALIGRNPKRTAVRIVVTAAVIFLTAHYLIRPIRVEGPSMMPTYRDNGINFLNRLAYSFHEPMRGDVVAIRFAGPSIVLMKRIVAMPGETVEFVGGQLYVNGKPQPEPYVKLPCRWELEPQKLGPDEYFVVGDNRIMRIVDHTFGKAARERILGKVLL